MTIKKWRMIFAMVTGLFLLACSCGGFAFTASYDPVRESTGSSNYRVEKTPEQQMKENALVFPLGSIAAFLLIALKGMAMDESDRKISPHAARKWFLVWLAVFTVGGGLWGWGIAAWSPLLVGLSLIPGFGMALVFLGALTSFDIIDIS